MNVLVTGATGFIGREVVRRLSQSAGRTVVAAVRSASAPPSPGVSTVSVAGLGPATDWVPALAGVDAVVHCAARNHPLNETSADALAMYREVNVEGTLTLARQAAAAGVRRFAFLSSIKVNGERTLEGQPFREDDPPAPQDHYARSKWEAEQALQVLARETGMEVVILRPPLVYGPGVKGNFAALMRWVATGLPIPLGAVRNNRRSLVALDNLVDLIVTCLEHPAAVNQVFLAGDGEDLSTAELLSRLAAVMGKPARLIPVPVWMLESCAVLLRRREVAQRLWGSLQVDISKARRLLGWRPPVSVDEGLRRAAWGGHSQNGGST